MLAKLNDRDIREREKTHENDVFSLAFDKNFFIKEIEHLELKNAAKNI